jgi:hypothetical protein
MAQEHRFEHEQHVADALYDAVVAYKKRSQHSIQQTTATRRGITYDQEV